MSLRFLSRNMTHLNERIIPYLGGGRDPSLCCSHSPQPSPIRSRHIINMAPRHRKIHPGVLHIQAVMILGRNRHTEERAIIRCSNTCRTAKHLDTSTVCSPILAGGTKLCIYLNCFSLLVKNRTSFTWCKN